MKMIFVLLILIMNFASADSKVVLLTSLIENETYSYKVNRRTEESLEKNFRRHFEKTDFDVIVRHKTSPDILWEKLNDPSVTAIFWVSHARGSKTLAAGIKEPERIVDAYGNDIKELFQRTTKNLRYLAVIGCEAQEVLDQYKNQKRYNSELTIRSFNHKISAKKGLKKALKESEKLLSENIILHEDEERQPEETITFRRTESFTKNILIKIEAGGEILSVMNYNGEDFELQTHVTRKNIIITLLLGDELPLFSISSGPESNWKLFQKDNQPIGNKRHLYIFKR